MTDTMINRIAKAIQTANSGEHTSDSQALVLAIAAVHAIREPTRHMLRAADAETDLVCSPGANTMEERLVEFERAWLAMADAILAEHLRGQG